MAAWIPHSQRSFITRSIRLDAIDAMETYLALCDAIGELGNKADAPTILAHVSGDTRHHPQVNELIALSLADTYGVQRVETRWVADDRPLVAQSVIQGDKFEHFVHRIQPAPERDLWVVLDTCTVWDVACGKDDALDVAAVIELSQRPRFALADAAVLELMGQLARGRLSFERWRRACSILEPLLDPSDPLAPGRKALFAEWGDQSGARGYEEERRHRVAVWSHLSRARSKDELWRESEYLGERDVYALQSSAGLVKGVVSDAQARYAEWFPRIEKSGRGLSVEQIAERVQAHLTCSMALADVVRLDLAISYLARRAYEYCNPKGGTRYRPKLNDALDCELLFALPRPAVVVSSDDTFVRVVEALPRSEGAVMRPPALLAWLRDNQNPGE